MSQQYSCAYCNQLMQPGTRYCLCPGWSKAMKKSQRIQTIKEYIGNALMIAIAAIWLVLAISYFTKHGPIAFAASVVCGIASPDCAQ